MITVVIQDKKDKGIVTFKYDHMHLAIKDISKLADENSDWFMFDSETNQITLSSKMVAEQSTNKSSGLCGLFILIAIVLFAMFISWLLFYVLF